MLQHVKFLRQNVSKHVEFFPPKPVKTRRFLKPVKQEQQQKKSFLRPLHYVTRGQKPSRAFEKSSTQRNLKQKV